MYTPSGPRPPQISTCSSADTLVAGLRSTATGQMTSQRDFTSLHFTSLHLSGLPYSQRAIPAQKQPRSVITLARIVFITTICSINSSLIAPDADEKMKVMHAHAIS